MKEKFSGHKVKVISLNSLIFLSCAVFFTVQIFFILPYIKAILPAFNRTTAIQNNYYLELKPLLKTIFFTLKQALISTLIAALIGVPAAFFVANRNFPGKKILTSFSSVPLCIPSLIIALGYISTFGMSGLVNRFFMNTLNLKNPPFTFLYSFWGIVLTQGFYNFPIVMKTVSDSWKETDTSQADSARLLGADEFRIFRTITFWQLLPSVISACIPIFLFCFFSFMIVLLFGAKGCTTLEVAIYHSGRSTLDFKTAGLLAIIETVTAFIILLFYSRIENRSTQNKGIKLNQQICLKNINGFKEKISFTLFLLIITLFFLLPFFSIFISSFISRTGGQFHFSLSAWNRLFTMRSFLPSIKNTLLTAAGTSSLCTVTAFVYAAFLRLKIRQNNLLLKTIPLLPMAVSSVVMGLGMSMLVKKGNIYILILAQTCLTWPFAFRQLYAHLIKIPDDTINASKLLEHNFCNTIFNILIPYTWRGIVSAFAFSFAMSAGDAALPLILSIPKFDTLSLLTYRLAGSFHFSEANASGLLLGIFCMSVFIAAEKTSQKG